MQKHNNYLQRAIPYIFTLLFLFGLQSVSLMAQLPVTGRAGANAPPEVRSRHLTDAMKKRLDLTPAQETKISVLSLNYFKNLETDGKIKDPKVQLKTIQDLNTKVNADLKAILTPSQYTDYQKLLRDFNKRQQQRRK